MIRMVVDFPAPLGPRKPVTRPGRGREADVVDGREGAVLLAEGLDLDHVTSLAAGDGVAHIGEAQTPDP